MKVLIILFVATCAILSVKADKEQQPGRGPPKALSPDQLVPPGPPGQHAGPPGPPGPESFNNFKTPQLNEFVNRLLRKFRKLSEQFGNRDLSSQCVLDHFREMFVNYNVSLKLTEEKFTSCVTKEMKALPEEAIAEVLSCLPTASDLQAKRDEAKAKFDALLDILKTKDEEISAMTDEVNKQNEITEFEWTDLYTFCTDAANNMFKDFHTITECLNTKRSETQAKVTKYLEEIGTCT